LGAIGKWGGRGKTRRGKNENYNQRQTKRNEQGKAAKCHGGLFLYKIIPGKTSELIMSVFIHKNINDIFMTAELLINTCLGFIFCMVGFKFDGLKVLSVRVSEHNKRLILRGNSLMPLETKQGVRGHVR